jgi:hypothetical protein
LHNHSWLCALVGRGKNRTAKSGCATKIGSELTISATSLAGSENDHISVPNLIPSVDHKFRGAQGKQAGECRGCQGPAE